jgi:hypothetical protein
MCAETDCDPFGACCFFNGSCTDGITEADCFAQDGISWVECSDCEIEECPEFGACCFCDGTCDELTEADCITQGGLSWNGSATCAETVCEAVGACCHPCSGECLGELTEAECANQDGVWQGACTTCDEVECPAIGACCLPDETCIDGVTEDECDAQGGVAWFVCTDCEPGLCTLPTGRVGCSEKGSLIVLGAVEVRWDGGGNLIQDTFIQLTNDYPEDVLVQMYFVQGDEPLPAEGDERPHPGWNWVDNEIMLTANQPVYWSVFTGLPQGVSPWIVLDPGTPPGRPAGDGSGDRVLRGYVLAWAVNSTGEEIRFNHLAGSVTVVDYEVGAAWEYNACAFPIVDPSVAHGESSGTPGVLNLDGDEYVQAFDLLLMNFIATGSPAFTGPRVVTANTDLTLLPISADLRQETDGPVFTKAHIDVWNENEVKFSGSHRCIACWDQTLLSDYELPNHFLLQHLQTDMGKARIDGLASALCPESEQAALIGISATHLRFDGGDDYDIAGEALHGMGYQDGVIQYDPLSPPPEFPQTPSADEMLDYIDALLEERRP